MRSPVAGTASPTLPFAVAPGAMRSRLSIALVFGLAASPLARGADATTLWSQSVQPLLDVHCVKCHGPIEQKSGLELDTPQAVLKGGDEGAIVVPGDPDKSRLYTYLAAGSDPHMPPKKQLSDADRERVREWIAAMTAVPDSAPSASAPDSKPAPRTFTGVSEAIDAFVTEAWSARNVTPAPDAGDPTWMRRVYLDLAGRIPSPSERETFLASQDPDRRAALVDRLLASEEYAVRMRELWDVFLMNRVKRESHEERRKEKGWWAFLEHAFRTNRPWNETVRDMLVARQGADDSRGASWFLYERRNDHQAIAEAVAPVVYGTKIDCAQCHDHPLAREIKQAHYWGLVAAFNRGKNVDGTAEIAESAIGGFVNFTNLKKESQPALITLLNGRTLDEPRPAGDQKEEDRDDNYVDPAAKVRVPKYSRREAFADAATRGNPLLARSFVNRMWSALFGRGLVHPADEMNARNAPSHPELLAWLAQDFAAHGHDARRFIRGVVLSRPYAAGASARVPADSFAGALERPLSGEQIARSWRVVAGLPPADDTLRRAVVTALPDVLPRDYTATFQQAQFLANSPALAAILNPGAGTGPEVSRITSLGTAAERVREAFLAAYGRLPDAEEGAASIAFLEQRADRPAEAVRDLLWALMTSAEFLMMP